MPRQGSHQLQTGPVGVVGGQGEPPACWLGVAGLPSEPGSCSCLTAQDTFQLMSAEEGTGAEGAYWEAAVWRGLLWQPSHSGSVAGRLFWAVEPIEAAPGGRQQPCLLPGIPSEGVGSAVEKGNTI